MSKLYARQAIVTKYHGPTNSRGSRVSATAEAGRVYVSYDDSLDTADAHAAAVKALCAKLDWHGRLVCGGTATGYVFCFDDGPDTALAV